MVKTVFLSQNLLIYYLINRGHPSIFHLYIDGSICLKKLSIKLKCSDKTVKKIIEKHAPYLLDIE